MGKDYKILSAKVKEGKLLVRSSKIGEDFSVLHLIDLLKKQVIARRKIKALKYYEALADFDEQRFVYCSVYHPEKISFYDLREDKETVLMVRDSSQLDAGDIVLQRGSLYYIKGVYGPSVWNIEENKLHYYQQEYTVKNPQLSSISYPLKDSLVILSRQQQAGGDSLKLYAVDASGQEKWSAVTEHRYVSPLLEPEIITAEDGLIVKSGKQLVKLNTRNGLTLTSRKFDDLNSIFRLGKEIIVFSVHQHAAFPAERAKYQVNVSGVSADSLNIAWSAGFEVTGIPQLGLINGELFLSDRDSIRVIDAANGRMKQHGPVKDSYIEMLTDAGTGEYYLLLNSEIVIW
ncbi:hypothetical protein [Chitinophaga filiformis]|uniref:hypothetical protein n=1 Tax=Chitinophaga filiformis TaxID=104663 RepID=UPI001F3FA02C|nr:hypothetical protein [Chitinophaga filiformis]